MASQSSSQTFFVWRLSSYQDVSGRGGLIASGRWHTRPRAVLYCADEPHTALCEILKQVGSIFLMPDDYKLLKISVPAGAKIEVVDEKALSEGWSQDGVPGWELCQPIGDEWIKSCRTAILKVPSAARPGSYNYLINSSHRDADYVEIVEVYHQPFPENIHHPATKGGAEDASTDVRDGRGDGRIPAQDDRAPAREIVRAFVEDASGRRQWRLPYKGEIEGIVGDAIEITFNLVRGEEAFTGFIAQGSDISHTLGKEEMKKIFGLYELHDMNGAIFTAIPCDVTSDSSLLADRSGRVLHEDEDKNDPDN
ncbi:RES family NAD+ phosphorylase [Methylobacterium frigidaeris]|uniref:RES domain-containing protein n=1 Tax=Methylobacterium frigidaeris TaxID=2038277 RepID=A0AA37H9Y7_9HYPH|nr:RES family NAD+ phosphorylase [Methylobacterium frigidaeris]GJD62133.1 hypothetical protein MPEAHAMD_2282 [Methylobacterium frigidaeris]